MADSTHSTHVTCLHGASTASWGKGQGWTWRQRVMCLLCDTNEASGLAVTYIVQTSSSCLQAALIGGITLMPMLAWGWKGRKKPCPGPEVHSRESPTSPLPIPRKPSSSPDQLSGFHLPHSSMGYLFCAGELQMGCGVQSTGGESLHQPIPALLPTQPGTCWPPSQHRTTTAGISAGAQRSPTAV